MLKDIKQPNIMFPCDGCGLCCQHIADIKELKDFHNGDGICIYLDKASMQCKIYETRPDVCQVEKMYDLVYHKEFKTKEQFYSANMAICTIFKEQQQEKLEFLKDI